jgi:putative membrane protein
VEATSFAGKVAAANTFEIQSSQLANERAQSADVKSFAQQMITDHMKAGAEFKTAVQAADMSAPAERPNAKQTAALSKLRSVQGPAFDNAYVREQLAAQEAVSLFGSYSKNGKTAPLKNFAAKTLPTLEHHLSMVQDLSARGVTGAPTGTGSRSANQGHYAGARLPQGWPRMTGWRFDGERPGRFVTPSLASTLCLL